MSRYKLIQVATGERQMLLQAARVSTLAAIGTEKLSYMFNTLAMDLNKPATPSCSKPQPPKTIFKQNRQACKRQKNSKGS